MSRGFYQSQLAQAGNATTALGVAQNLSAIFVMINGGQLDHDMYVATPIVVLPAVIVAMLFYLGLIFAAYRQEAALAATDPDNLNGGLSPALRTLCCGRMACIFGTAVPLLWLAYSFSAHKVQ